MAARSDVIRALGPAWLTPGRGPGLPRPLATVIARCAVVAVVVLATATIHFPGRPATFCVLRAVTGVPCPFCGGTTAAVHLGHGDLAGAASASPLAIGLLLMLPFVGVLPVPRWWARRRLRRTAILGVLLAAELWQLGRYGFLSAHT